LHRRQQQGECQQSSGLLPGHAAGIRFAPEMDVEIMRLGIIYTTG